LHKRVAPLRIGGGMRMKVLQAMALGKAVVTTSRGVDGLMIDDQPLPLIIAEGDQAIAEATASLLSSRDARRSLGCQARAFVTQNFSAQAYARRIEASYVELAIEAGDQITHNCDANHQCHHSHL
jgi:glycosyltransferase involved in cell wall biosynthesis